MAERKPTALDRLLLAGQRLSNVAFNLAQGRGLRAEDSKLLDDMRKEWDAAQRDYKTDGAVKTKRKAKRRGR